MSRSVPPDRLDQLVDSAARVFSERGYHRAQMSEIAEAAGVAAGTLYNYVEGKEALFDLCVQRAFRDPPPRLPAVPVRTPRQGELVIHVRQRMRSIGGGLVEILRGLDEPPPAEPAIEVERLVRGLYDYMAQNRRVLGLLERAATDRPDLAPIYFERGRRRLLDRLAGWIARRTKTGAFRSLPDPAVAARLMLEACAWFARHRHGDYAADLDDEIARETVVVFCQRALLKESP